MQFIKIVQLIKKKFDVSKICLENVMLLYSKEIKGLNMCILLQKIFHDFKNLLFIKERTKIQITISTKTIINNYTKSAY